MNGERLDRAMQERNRALYDLALKNRQRDPHEPTPADDEQERLEAHRYGGEAEHHGA